MADVERSKASGTIMLVSFLVGTAIGVGLILLAEKQKNEDIERGYGEGPLFV
jgi:hypothetical protein